MMRQQDVVPERRLHRRQIEVKRTGTSDIQPGNAVERTRIARPFDHAGPRSRRLGRDRQTESRQPDEFDRADPPNRRHRGLAAGARLGQQADHQVLAFPLMLAQSEEDVMRREDPIVLPLHVMRHQTQRLDVGPCRPIDRHLASQHGAFELAGLVKPETDRLVERQQRSLRRPQDQRRHPLLPIAFRRLEHDGERLDLEVPLLGRQIVSKEGPPLIDLESLGRLELPSPLGKECQEIGIDLLLVGRLVRRLGQQRRANPRSPFEPRCDGDPVEPSGGRDRDRRDHRPSEVGDRWHPFRFLSCRSVDRRIRRAGVRPLLRQTC